MQTLHIFHSSNRIYSQCLGALIAVFCCATVHAGESRRITLKDGSVIVGKIVSLTNGEYTVQSGALGKLTLKDADIVSMSALDAAPAPAKQGAAPAAPTSNPDLTALQQRISTDPAIGNTVKSLQDSPEVKDILADPTLMQAVQSGNLEALQGNPKIERLIKNPAVQDLIKRVAP
jgi:hypothetical protein